MVQFGTSGLRGLARDLTDDVVASHVAGFLRSCGEAPGGLWVGRDLRDSSPRIAQAAIDAARALGVNVTDCGAVPTPALALVAGQAAAAALMVTGSHIPADRNGLKFYTVDGEITKDHEAVILAALGPPDGTASRGQLTTADANATYLERARVGFGTALQGMRVALWSHAAAGRDVLGDALRQAGAEVREVGRAEAFVAVDTEAVDEATRAQLAAWADDADALVSTDGDGDRPLVCDPTGAVVPGDLLGQITARALGAEVVVTPVSSNSGVEANTTAPVIRTKIGSPHVIAAMEAASGKVIGYEANGGVLLAYDADGPAGVIPALLTRDSLLPIFATLVEAKRAGSLAARVAQEPARVTVTDRLQDVARDRMDALIAELSADPSSHLADLAGAGAQIAHDDRTDGLRLTLTDGRILHLRPSGNAPELRFYVEAGDSAAAAALSDRIRAALLSRL